MIGFKPLAAAEVENSGVPGDEPVVLYLNGVARGLNGKEIDFGEGLGGSAVATSEEAVELEIAWVFGENELVVCLDR